MARGLFFLVWKGSLSCVAPKKQWKLVDALLSGSSTRDGWIAAGKAVEKNDSGAIPALQPDDETRA